MGATLTRRFPADATLIRSAGIAALIALAAVAALLLLGGDGADALRAAGLTKDGVSISGVKGFVDTIANNVLWIIGTTAVLAFLVIGGLFWVGHSRAQDFAVKTIIGALIIIAAPGLAA